MSKQRGKYRKRTALSQPAAAEAIQTISDDERYAMIAEAAYLLAEQRGFGGDAALDDWLRAEAEISARLPEIG